MNNGINKTRIKELKNQLSKTFQDIEETAGVLEPEDRREFNSQIAKVLYDRKLQMKNIQDILLQVECLAPNYEEKILSVESALYRVRDNHLLDFMNDIDEIIEFAESNKPDENSKQIHRYNATISAARKMREWVVTELYDRVQAYRLDIEKLTGNQDKNEAA